MAVKHVREYYERMVSDYTEMKNVLSEMEKLSESGASNALNNIEQIKEQVKVLEVNYKRLSYIMFLLNQPNKENKKNRYIKRENKKLNQIPIEDRKEAVEEENKQALEILKSYS
ncbi:MAG: hypothetical protein IJH55_07135 [Romboutsia sp.]|nr:hypothetical protein [Romboutsia sp.]